MKHKHQSTAPFRRGQDRRQNDQPVKGESRTQERRTHHLEWILLFKGVNIEAVTNALKRSEVLNCPAGTALLRVGAINQHVFILLAGILSAHLDADLNPDKAISLLPGECVGELSVIDGKPVSALIVAETDIRVVRVSGELFWNELMIIPGVARNLALMLAERVRKTNLIAFSALREQLELGHLRRELEAARQLQSSMLPLQRPLFPECKNFEICGLMQPASSVGGDLFDAFFIDERRIFFCIGDVSGHGIAAALFMARTIGLLRIMAMHIHKPDELLCALNQRLCTGNDTNLFVTLFCGFLDTHNGELSYSNGGHCAPLIHENGTTSLLSIPKGPLVGVIPHARFFSQSKKLAYGEILLCYSDGITEAQNSDAEAFSEARCMDIVNNASQLDLPELLDKLHHDVQEFAGTKIMEDDCTMLAVRCILG